jgi:hypothetical protein
MGEDEATEFLEDLLSDVSTVRVASPERDEVLVD